MHSLGYRTILDIGANTGQFARNARRVLPEAEIHCFEPLPGACDTLRKLARRDSRLFVHQTAVGEISGEIEFHESAYSPSSSPLPMAETHTQLFDGTATSRTLRVPVTRLDDWSARHTLGSPILLKLDVQGYEDRVLRGGAQTLARTDVIIIEVSFVELYHGQLLFDDVYMLLRSLGFQAAGVQGTVIDRQAGNVLQADAIFVNRLSQAASA